MVLQDYQHRWAFPTSQSTIRDLNTSATTHVSIIIIIKDVKPYVKLLHSTVTMDSRALPTNQNCAGSCLNEAEHNRAF